MAAPKLRFKEFDNQWDKIKINDQAQTVTSGSRDWAQYYSESGDKFIRMTNLVRDGIYLDLSDLKFVQLPKDSNEGKRTSLKFGDILISITAELGKLGWIPEGLGTAYINQHTALVRMKDSVDSKFIAYSLSTEKYNNKLNSLNDSGAKAGLNLGTIRNFELIVPPKEEQTKIASFLSAVDEKISQLTQKHALLSQYKQGMMQKLFSQQLRFKADDGNEFGEWNKVLLGDCVDILTNGLSLDQNMNGNGFKVTRIETISNFNIDLSRVGYVDTQSDISSYRLEIGDILFSNINSIAHIGKVVYIDKDYDIYHGMNLLRIQFKKNLDKKFMFYELSQKTFKQHFESIANKAVNQASINQTALKKTELCAPCLEEQIKIANFLSAIDQKIEVVAQQIEQAKTWKKGLLQQMFV
ncbi:MULTISPECIES: restriction endonuclease subunit S [unclassified Acinetobacter]|uniref:restriction endonuclease subunit S n=1 Tax=unclassified Acinetobacter TaxID=196816 RepID=UPI0015D10481|nr:MULTISPECIES: restriction endonuclease subunit S [unclassified Acinetobacter]